ncbi:MAG: selenide, water dikinase SelD, partial [Spirochaetota bacterium]
LVGLTTSDDAAVYKITEELAVIQTVDFFTPVVDNPCDYGAIAAANALSDIYAMGGEVAVALNICAFPAKLPITIINDILKGGSDKVKEAGGVLAGGHTICDNEPKYGLSVMGFVHPARIFTKAGARPGDILVLTKPLGTGIITTAAKADRADPLHAAKAVDCMKLLNKDASAIFQETGIHACTDITGFALLGHSYEMAEKSGVRLHFAFHTLPFLEGAVRYAGESLFPGGSFRNKDFYKDKITFSTGISDDMQMLLFTPETSGGLLAAISKDKMDVLENLLTAKGHFYRIVGEVTEGTGVEVTSG